MHDLRFAKAIYMPRQSGDAAPAKTPYDPVKALDGMFNGSVTRVAYALKDPVNFGALTKAVLTECAKRFHDALDDCEIQLLDAKWYLEDQLAQNKARREAKAREMGTTAKRKHDEIKDPSDNQPQEDTPVKRSKIESSTDTPAAASIPQSKQENPSQQPPPSTRSPNPSRPAAGSQPEKQADKHPAQESKPEITAEPARQEEPQLVQDDFAKPTPQATPSGTNDDFNFESMFGEPPGDSIDLKDDNDGFGYDLGTTDSLNATTNGNEATENQDPSSLESLLPGLDTFANQMNDTNNAPATTTSADTGSVPLPQPLANEQQLPAFSNDFGLPEVGSANIFDAFLNDDSLNDGGNYQDAVGGDMLDDNFLNMDLDMNDDFFQ